MLNFFDTETISGKNVIISDCETFIYDKNGLTYSECFNFMLSQSQKYNYFFRIDYDVNLIIKDLPDNIILKILSGDVVTCKKYRIQYYRHKIFILNGKKFFDVYNFFNSSLLSVINILKIELTNTEHEFLKVMKSGRADFTISQIKTIGKYSVLENKIGLRIVQKIYDLIPEDLKTYSLYGSSVLANIFLRKKNIKQSEIFSTQLFETSYFGGRSEVFKIGTFKNVYKYDINSAYPNIIKDLKEPLSYTITDYNGQSIIDSNLYVCTFKHKTVKEIGCLPVRLKGGYLVFPASGSGIFYGCELLEAKKRKVELNITKEIKIVLGKRLFNGEIESFYKLRNEYKKQKDLRNLIYKILLNSIYGKFAQKVGKTQFRNLYLAGYITAKTRSELLKVTYNQDDNIIFFATDGILSKKKLNIKPNKKLGGWDFEKISRAVVILSGIYKLYYSDNTFRIGERGFKIDFEKVIKDIKKQFFSETNFNVFISALFAIKNYKAYYNYKCKFTSLKKVIDIRQQHKRNFLNFDIDKENSSILLQNSDIKKIVNINIKDIVELSDSDYIIL